MWKLINSLSNCREKCLRAPETLFNPIKSNYISIPKGISKIFNTYFVSIGQQIASKIPTPIENIYPVNVNGPEKSIVLHDAFIEDVDKVITK